MGGKTGTSTSTVQVPADVLSRYNAVNTTAETAAQTPFQSYSNNASAFVAPLTSTQQSGIANTNAAANQAQPAYQAGMGLTALGAGAANPSQLNGNAINQYLSPYLGDVLGSTAALTNQNNQQAMAGQLGNAITSGAFGGDRSGIAAANLAQQQQIAEGNVYSGIANQGYNNALATAQQQQGVDLGAQQANLARLSNAGQQIAGLGAGAQSANLQGATAQLTAGQQEQATNQAGQTALYNQFLQQQAYPFQTAQFLANIAEGTGSLSGSTTTSTQPTGLFGNLLSDRRAKEDIRQMGKAKNGLNIYSFKYKGDPDKVTHIGFMADEVEKKHPEAVGLAGGLKTVDYDRASRADGGQLMFDPSQGAYGLSGGMPGKGGYVPAGQQGQLRRIAFQANAPTMKAQGLGAAAQDFNQLAGIGSTGKGLVVGNANGNTQGLMGAGGNWDPSRGYLAHGGLALARHYDDGGGVDPYNAESDSDLNRKEAGLRYYANGQAAPDSPSNTAVSGALGAQATAPHYSLNAAPVPGQGNSGGPGQGNSGGLAQIGSVIQAGKTIAPFAQDAGDALLAAFAAFKRGGLVGRNGYADGGDPVSVDDLGNPILVMDNGAPPKQGGLYGGLPDKFVPAPDAPAGLARGAASPNVPLPPTRPSDISPDTPHKPAPGAIWPLHANNDNSPAPGLGTHYEGNSRIGKVAVADTPDQAQAWGLGAGQADLPAQGSQNAQMAGMPSGVNSSMWTAPRYNGPRPETPPDPKNYGTDQAGQAAFIRDYSAYRGVDPKFTLGVANAEGLRAINSHNPNGASSVDIDPNTGKPFSFGAFQLNVRNGLGNVAIANGIDPTNPEHGNLANKFAIDQMATGGLKPWRGDAAVNAYQHGEGQTTEQPSGLLGGLGHMFGGDNGQSGSGSANNGQSGGMGERALMAVLSGLGAVGSYKGQSPLGAILQGLGGGAKGWMESGTNQANVNQTNANTGRIGAETGLVGAQTNTQNATTMGARQELIGKAKWVDPYGQMWVHTADDRVMTESQWNDAGRPTLYGQGLASPTVPAPSTPPATAAPNQPAPPSAPSAPSLVSPPTPEPPPAVPFGVNMDQGSIDTAKNDINAMKGPNFDELKKQSAGYYKETQDGMKAASDTMPYTQELAKVLNQAYNSSGSMAAPGAGFNSRASVASIGNTLERLYGGKETFGEADTQEQIANKVDTLRATMTAKGAGQQALGALDELKAATPNLTQNPKASSALIAQMMADEVKARDKAQHAQTYGQISHGSYFNAANDFNTNNGPQKYNQERDELQRLLLTQPPKVVENLTSGKYPQSVIREQLKKNGFPEGLARYFSTGG